MEKKSDYSERRLYCILSKQTIRVMKLTTLFTLMTIFQLYASDSYSQLTRITLKVENDKISDVLKKIEEKSEYYFLYSPKLINVEKRVSINVKDEPVKAILNTIFDEDVKFEIYDRQIILTKEKIFTVPAIVQQQNTISGVVTDENGSTMPGVSIQVEGTSIGVMTDVNGKYAIELPGESGVLIFTFIGYTTQKIPVKGGATVNVKMIMEAQNLDQIIVVGYGTQKKSLVTGSISSINAESFKNTSVRSAAQAIQGKVSGVQVLPQSGSPGSGMTIRVRGVSTNGNSAPLYIVDGMRTPDINNLAPGDIESMEILKDAASSAIYGAEGGNGVVLITTKSGAKQKSLISYDFQYTTASVGKLPSVMNSDEYVSYYKDAGLDYSTNGTNTDWLGSIFETGLAQNHHLSYSSGNENSKVFISGSYLKQDGIIESNKDTYDRYSLRFNGEHKAKKWLKIGNNFTYSHISRSAISEDSEFGGALSSAMMLDPLTPTVYTDPSQIDPVSQAIIDAHPEVVRDNNGNIYGISPTVTGEIMNPFVSNAIRNGSTITDQFLGSLFAEISPVKNFTFTSRFGLDGIYSVFHRWLPKYYHTSQQNNDSPTVREDNRFQYHWQWENFATYARSFKDNNLSIVVGMESQSFKLRTTSLSGGPMGLNQESFSEFDYITGQASSKVYGNMVEDARVSYFGRVSYDYKNKYMLQGSLRRDGASTYMLPEAGRWGVFPSVSAGWVISNENFFTKSFVTSLKVRGSWGKNGSLSNLGGYQYYGFLTSTGMLFPARNNVYYIPVEPSRLNNPDLTWETSQQTDIGIDLRAWNNRLTFSTDYYFKKTIDLLTPNTPPFEAGNVSAYINAGDVVNKGFEFDLGLQNTEGELRYHFNLNLSTLKNEVTYLNPTIARIPGTPVGTGWTATYCEVGQPIWYFRGYKTKGVDPSTGEMVFEDVNKDGNISSDDYTYIGKPTPDLLFGGTIKLEYKNFDFNVFMQGTQGNDILMGFIRNDRTGINRLNIFTDDRWTSTNTGGSMPRAGVEAQTWNSDLVVFDGSYLRFKQIQLGYSIPEALLSKIKFSSARAYISFDDFITITKYPGLDPEAGSVYNNSLGIDRGVYPAAKKVVLGVSIAF